MNARRGRGHSNRSKDQAKERQAEQMRRYSRASSRAYKRLKAAHPEEFFTYLDEELPKIYQELGPLPYEEVTTPWRTEIGDSQESA